MNPSGSLPSLTFMVYLAIGFLVSCSSDSPLPVPVSYIGPRYLETIPNDPRRRNLIEREFLPLVESFEAERGIPVSTPIYFTDDLPNSVLGVCIVWSKDDVTVGEIRVNQKTFGRSRFESEMIIFHELGHCELKRPHTEELTRLFDQRIIPYSLMFPSIFLSSDYSRFREHYIIELFGRGGILVKIDAITEKKDSHFEIIQSDQGFTGYVYH